MTFRQLESFLAVAREGSFSRAAVRIHLSQPTLSEHIAELERELGARLFHRGRRGGVRVALTDAGRVLAPHASHIIAAIGDARHAVSEADGLAQGTLLVGASTTPGIYVLPRIVSSFQQRHPGVTLTLTIANSRVIEERVRADELDLGVVGGHVLGPGERCVAAGLVDELVLIAAPLHPWARRKWINPRQLTDERLLIREPGSATRHVMERSLQQADVSPARTLELNHTEAIKQSVMAGLGVAFVSRYAVQSEVRARQLAIVALRGLRMRRHFHVIQSERRTLGIRARAFLTLLENEAHRRPRKSA
jgi:DNA-binding transcriptional LysR family regulator